MEIFNITKLLNLLSILFIFFINLNNQYSCNDTLQKNEEKNSNVKKTFNSTEAEKDFMGKKFDFFMPRYDFQRPYKFRKEHYNKLMKYASDHKRKVEVPKDTYIMNDELIAEYEEIYKKEILHRIINKEVNLEEVAYDENYDIYAYPDVNEYRKQKPKFISNEDHQMKNYETLGNFLKFSHKKIEVVDKPICIATMVILNIQNIRNENIVIKSIKSDLFQAAIFISKGKEMPHSYNQKNLYPKVLVPEENFSLQVIVLPEMIGRTVGNIYFELSDNKVIVFPLEIKAVENIYKISPIYVHNWPGSKLFISQINLYNPHPKTLIIKEVINSFSSINLIWPNGQPVSSNHTSLSSSMLEVPSKTSKNILQINFYKDVPGVEYGLLQLKTDRDTLIIPVVVGVEVQAIKFYPNYYNFGVIDLNRPIKRLIPMNLSNLGLNPIQIKSIYSSFEENLIEFVPNLNNFFCNFDLILSGLSLSNFSLDSKGGNGGVSPTNPNSYTSNICIINRIDNMNNFGFLMIDPSNFKEEINGKNMNKKVRGSILIQTNFTDNPFIELTYEYLLDRNTLSFEKEPELYFENSKKNEINFDVKAHIKSPFYTTFRDLWRNTTSDLSNYPNNLLYSNFEIEELNKKISEGQKFVNKETKELNLKLRILNVNQFQNKKNYFFPVKLNSNMITLLPVKLYDKSIELHYCDNIANYKDCLSENYSAYKAINFKSQNLNIDFGLLTTSEAGKKYFNLINDNGQEIKIEKIESDSPLISLAIESVEDYHTNKRIYYNSKYEIGKAFPISNKKNAPSLTIPAESYINLSINLASKVEEDFSGVITIHMGKDIKFKINLTAKFLKGNLNITPSTVRFEPAFPGLFQSKLVSSKSSYNIPINIHSIKSFDQRIIPVILTNSIISNNRTEIVKIVFDPSKVEIEENFMKGDGFANSTSKHLTYKELYLWKEKQKLWEILGSQGRTEINTLVKIKTNIQTETVNVRGFLTKPSLVKKDEVEFGLVQLGESNSTYIEVFNPSDEPMSIQILLAPEEFSDIHNNSMFFNSKQRLFPLKNITILECNYFNISNFIDQTSQNFTQNFINNRSKKKGKKKEDENESNIHSVLLEEEMSATDLNERKIMKYDLLKKIFLYTNINSKINFLESERVICNTNFFKKNEIIFNNNKELIEKIFSEEFMKEINIIKRMTDRSPPSNQRHSNRENSQNIFEKIAQNLKVFFKTDSPARKKRNEDLANTKQEFFLPKALSSQVFVIKPHQKTKIGPIIYSPNVHSNNSTATLFIKNNLTVLYPIKLKGYGGSGLLNFFLQNNKKNENEIIEEKIEKLVININSLNDIENDNNEIKKVLRIQNTGNLPVNVSNTTVKDSGCEGYGIRLSNCNSFSLKPNESMKFVVTIIPDFNFYYLEKEILFKTTHQQISIKVIISISTEILIEKNRLFNFDNLKNYGVFYMSGSASIILIILYILRNHKEELKESEANKKQVLNFVSGKDIIENNNHLKFENLYIKAYRPNNRSFYEDFFSKHLDAPSKSEVEHLISEKKKKVKTDSLIRNKESVQEENNSEKDIKSRPSENERKETKVETSNTTREKPTVKKTEKSKTTTTKKTTTKKQPIGITAKTTEKKDDEKKTLHNILNSNQQPQNLLPGSIYSNNKNPKAEYSQSYNTKNSNENQPEKDSNLSGSEFYSNSTPPQNWVENNAYYQQMGFWPKNYQGGNVSNFQNFVPQQNANIKGFNNNAYEYNANFNKQGKHLNNSGYPYAPTQANTNSSKTGENKSQVSLNPNNPNFIPQFIQAGEQFSNFEKENTNNTPIETNTIENILGITDNKGIDLNKKSKDTEKEKNKSVTFKENNTETKDEKNKTKAKKTENMGYNRDEIKPSVGATNIKEQFMSFVPGNFTSEDKNKDEASGASNFLNMNFINPDDSVINNDKVNDSKNEGKNNESDSNQMDNFKMIDFTNYFTNKENENENNENSENDDQNIESANENDFEFNKYRSDREKIIEDSGTEDRGNDIKFNFNSIFGQNSMKLMNNQINDYNTDNEEPVKQNLDGNKPYFDNKLFFSFDSVFNDGNSKQQSAGGLFNSGNLFSGNANKTGGLLSELRDDENEKDTGKRNDDWNKINKLDDVVEIEDDEDDEEDPLWGDDNVADINKEGFFDASGNYKLKQMDFNFNLDFNSKK